MFQPVLRMPPSLTASSLPPPPPSTYTTKPCCLTYSLPSRLPILPLLFFFFSKTTSKLSNHRPPSSQTLILKGADYLKKNAGKVATEEFVASHPADIIERTLSTADFAKMTLGPVDKASHINNH